VKRTLESEGDDDEFEGGEPEYHPEADDPGVFWCPHCGSEMYGDSMRCPKCGDYVTPGRLPSGSMPWWMWLLLILVGIGMLAGIVSSFR
jgi:hypothetical protein